MIFDSAWTEQENSLEHGALAAGRTILYADYDCRYANAYFMERKSTDFQQIL